MFLDIALVWLQWKVGVWRLQEIVDRSHSLQGNSVKICYFMMM